MAKTSDTIQVTKSDALRLHLKNKIVSGEWTAGHRLPTERNIAADFGVSRLIVREALTALSLEGLLDRIQGSGSYVTDAASQNSIDRKPLVLLYPLRGELTKVVLDPYRMQLVDGINHCLSMSLYQQMLSLCPMQEGERLSDRISSKRWHEELAGGILVHPHLVEESDLNAMHKLGINVVSIGKPNVLGEVSFADIDNISGVSVCMDHLLRMGHERVLLINGSTESSTFHDRYTGYSLKLGQYGIPESPELQIQASPWDQAKAYERVSGLIKNGVTFTAVLCCGGGVTSGVIQALKEAKLRIPQDVSLVSYGFYPSLFSWDGPEITSVIQPVFQLGFESAMLLEQLKKPGSKKVLRKIIQPELTSGASCCPPSS